jgi:hypothetical protein
MLQTLNDISHLILLIFHPLDLNGCNLKTGLASQASSTEWQSEDPMNAEEKELKHQLVIGTKDWSRSDGLPPFSHLLVPK